MAQEVPPLPYAYDALEPHIDEQTMHLHHDKHHQAYVTNFNAAIEKHPMFWQIMGPGGGGEPTGAIAEAINSTFGSVEALKAAVNDAGVKRFGSGWTWLVKGADGKLAVVSTPNQDNPMSDGQVPILGNDVWEHAYYLKYQNRRPEYLAAWWNTINWTEVNKRFEQAG